jgi:putative tricarboxylic transport membrane protein
MMRRRDPWAAGALLCFGLAAIVEARRPGPGFFPFWLAVAFFIVTLALFVLSFRAQPAVASVSGPLSWRALLLTFLSLLGYALALEPLGFLLATFLFMLVLFRAVEPLGWPAAVGGSLATSLLAYALFKVWLQVQLPTGPWGL